jgi:hypothetical protein
MQDPFVPLELDLNELEPVSEMRPTGARVPSARPAASARPSPTGVPTAVQRLIVDTGLRGGEAATAWVTVSDEAGAVLFEGVPDAEGHVHVTFVGLPAVERVHILLETARLHRQAEVPLREGTNSHTFA